MIEEVSAVEMTAAAPVALTEQSDLDLVERHRYGDAQAFEEIYQRFGEMVYNLALRLSGDAEEAADLSQEVFLRVFRHLARFRGGSALKTWIYRVALNHCRSRLGRRRPLLPLPDRVEDSLVDPRRGPEERTLADAAGLQVERALARLTPVFREAVVLRDLEDLSYDEIAAVLGVRIGTVRSRIARGREQLREMMEAGA